MITDVRVEAAETGRLGEAIARVLPALERFVRYEGEDRGARDRDRWRAALDTPLPAHGGGLDAVMDRLATAAIPYGLRNGAPGFAGWITTSPTTGPAVAALAASIAGSQRWWVQPFNLLETVGLRWLAELLGLPAEWQGTFNSGGSAANLLAIGAARQHAFERVGIDPARDGLIGAPRWRVYASTEVHHVVTRAAAVVGLGRRSVRMIGTDAIGRIQVEALRAALDEDARAGIHPVAIVATAGTVNTGAIDPIAELADIADERGIWLHVDGAYGLFGRLDERVAPLYAGLERASSVAVDPHKWLAVPLGCGATFVRDRALMGRAFTLEPAEYLEGAASSGAPASPFDEFGDLYHDFNVEQSAQSRGVTVWAALAEIGRDGMRDRVRRHNDFARHVERRARADDRLEVLAPATLSICCFRYRGSGLPDTVLDRLNAEIARRLRAETRSVPSTTLVGGRYAIRPCFINPRTTLADVDALVDNVRRIGDEVAIPE
ncbi:MAG TPA: aminotransferase class I/II-fold pyridoxal phosphate-dependent enzyme [Candidatus Limnocylindria bacterium]|nr:aminotransferase class I/II-fold pyridoxal phosphate-dependent enzyme [Candidatus Limnocylindria bacterium]